MTITQFIHKHTHETYLPLFPSRKASLTALWLVLIALTHEGMARLSAVGLYG